ncbi:hypothetical protein [Silvibacterium acidisoli]|uniref:hypothetical protein n=1 Tax=Acidobacteriaceae bacterium ZG23-2 TaxID=2883246 RepID=UPI00406C7145
MNASVAEIDLQLREEFRRHLGEYGMEWTAMDPILAVLFRTLAHQIGSITSNTSALRSALLGELLDGLNFDRRFAQPSQTIVAFRCEQESAEIAAGTELVGMPEHGGRSSFLTDYGISVSPARVAGVFVYENESLRLVSGMALPEETVQAEPGYDAVPARLGSFPSIYIAVENLPQSHLSRHGIFLQISPEATLLHAQLRRENWCLASSSGRFTERGLMRTGSLNGGQIGLEWLMPAGAGRSTKSGGEEIAPDQAPALPGGFWQGRCFVLPLVPKENDFLCRQPQGLEFPLRQIFRRYALFDTPRAWLRIQLDPHVEPLHTALTAVHLHAQSASNVQLLHQTVRFPEHGKTIPLNPEGRNKLFLVSALSIAGESGTAYVPEYEQGAHAIAGRYRIEQQRITLTPGRMKDGRPEAYANVRLWMTEGREGNGMGTSRLNAFGKPTWTSGLTVENVTASAGGTDGEALHSARQRFAEVLLSRERLITRTDIEVAVRSFDTRITAVEVTPRAQRGLNGSLRRVFHLLLHASRERFEGEEEPQILLAELRRFLRERVPLDVEVSLELAWA